MAALNFPDVNVWLALTWSHHLHFERAQAWFRSCFDERFYFCRITQMSLLRLLATESIMREDTLTMKKAWEVHDRWYADPRVQFMAEPIDVSRRFKNISAGAHCSPKLWADVYLAAFADTAGLELVTFDQAFDSRGISCMSLT